MTWPIPAPLFESRWRASLPLALAWGLALGCAESLGTSGEDALNGDMATQGNSGNSPSGAVVPGAASPDGQPIPTPGEPALPPEVELDLTFELPQAGERYVYAANPQSDNVAVIDAKTLGIMAVEAGDQPTFLQTLAGTDAAVVLNVASSDASIIRTSQGSSTSVTVPVQQGANAIAVSPDGQNAVVYFDATHRGAGVTGSYQDISVLFLEPGNEEAVAMTVGFRPSSVSFTEAGDRAFIVTEDGISVLELAEVRSRGAHIARTLPLGEDAEASLDVSITPDGAYALARREGESRLRLLDLESGEVSQLDLAEFTTPRPPPPPPVPAPVDAGGAGDAGSEDIPVVLDASAAVEPDAGPVAPPEDDVVEQDAGLAVPPVTPAPVVAPPPAAITDVDLAPSGEFALAVVRDLSTVLQVPIPEGFTNPGTVTSMVIAGEVIGSVDLAPDSSRALLYTTVVQDMERLTILDMESREFDVVRLAKSVERVLISDDSAKAFVVHQKLEGDPNQLGIDPDMVIDRSYGYSVVDLASGFTKLQTALSPVGPATVVPTGTDLFVLFNDRNSGSFEVHQVELESFLVDRITLGSPPTSIGSVPGSQRVFVGQDHPDGRISFIDWETGELESVTGFELNSRIRE